ncbi:hypothetical protein FE257_003703 [Aspergillus nanangensis]|uniref:RTA1 domain protein n=1 Tax=Aspergillus nanangensis TaxID=2582783 RepID=A0AAD4CS24_ASPNN|nr:hypothetical protein FE257_003703 [Aspergillus nanangensis]
MAQLKPFRGDYYLWEYVPSLAAAVIFAILFLGATAFHFWKLWKTRARFCIAFALGGLFEVIGYIARAAAHNDTSDLISFSMQNVFILLGPILFAASVYMTLGRIIRTAHGEHHSLVPVRWLTKAFVMGDVLSFLVQGSAAGLMASGSNAEMGKNIVIAGLVIQLIVFGFFIVTSAVFEVRMDRRPTGHGVVDELWRRPLHTLYVVSALIMARSVFRVIEYAMGNKGYLLSNEWTLYVFDSLLMWAVMVIWGIWHPGTLQGVGKRGCERLELRSTGSM